MKTYLIAHENEGGNGIAQVTVIAKSEAQAKRMFTETYPQRVMVTIAEKSHA